MAARPSIDVSGWLHEQLAQASPDLLRAMVTTFAEALMSAEADAVCGAPFGLRSEDRVNTRNGYRGREWDTRAGSIELAIPKLRQGGYFPDWLLERRRRAEAALVSVVATSYLLGVSTRRMSDLAIAQAVVDQAKQLAGRRPPWPGSCRCHRGGRRCGRRCGASASPSVNAAPLRWPPSAPASTPAGDRPAMHRGVRLPVPRCQPGPRAHFAGIGEAGDVAELGDEHRGQDRADAVDLLDHAVTTLLTQGQTDRRGGRDYCNGGMGVLV
jgi:hypothetical protein